MNFGQTILAFEKALKDQDTDAYKYAESLCDLYKEEEPPIKISVCDSTDSRKDVIRFKLDMIDKDINTPFSIDLDISQKPTIGDLKRTLALRESIPINKQIWIINNQLHVDDSTRLDKFTNSTITYRATVYLLTNPTGPNANFPPAPLESGFSDDNDYDNETSDWDTSHEFLFDNESESVKSEFKETQKFEYRVRVLGSFG